MLALRSAGSAYYNKRLVVVHVPSSMPLPKLARIPADVQEHFTNMVTLFPELQDAANELVVQRFK